MNPLPAGLIFLICLFFGIVMDNVAIGILAGLVLGGAAGKAGARKSRDGG